MKPYNAYATYRKPPFAPSPKVFGPVWTVLYVLIFVTYAYVAYLFVTMQLPGSVLIPFAMNLVFNLLYTPIQFKLQNFALATLDILLTLATLIWALVIVYPYASWVALANVPYLLWVCFATVLQITIFIMNKGRMRKNR